MFNKQFAILLMLFSIFIAACSQKSGEVVSEIIEMEQAPVELEQYLEYPLLELKIPFIDLPYLNDYLLNLSIEEKIEELSRLEVSTVGEVSNGILYLLSYGGGMKEREQLLIIKEEEGWQSLYLDFCIIKATIFSPDRQQLLLIRQHNEGEIYRNSFAVVDLEPFIIRENLYLNSFSSHLNYLLPFLDYGWIGNNQLFFDVPLLEQFDYEDILEWYNQDKGRLIQILVELD